MILLQEFQFFEQMGSSWIRVYRKAGCLIAIVNLPGLQDAGFPCLFAIADDCGKYPSGMRTVPGISPMIKIVTTVVRMALFRQVSK